MPCYFLTAGCIPAIKIGFTGDDPAKRFLVYQARSPVPLQLAAVDPHGDKLTESELLHRFADDRMHGEWVVATRQMRDVVDAVARGERVPGGWYLPNPRANTSYVGLNKDELMARFGLSSAKCTQLGGIMVASGFGLGVRTLPRTVAYLRARGHDITFLDLLYDDLRVAA